MDEFELFRARASGCEVTGTLVRPGDSADNSSESGNKRSRRRESRRVSSRRKQDDRLDVSIEVQPPSPLMKHPGCKDHGSGSGSGGGDGGGDGGSFGRGVEGVGQSGGEEGGKHGDKEAKHNDTQLVTYEILEHKTHTSNTLSLCHGTSLKSSFRASYNDVSHNELLCTQTPPDEEPALYRVRNFTTRKGEIVSRGDSFKSNKMFLGVKKTPSFRRSSEAVAQLSCSLLQPLAPSRRSSFTCLPQGGGRSGSLRRGVLSSSFTRASDASLQSSVREENEEGGVEEEMEKMEEIEKVAPQEFQVVVLGAAGVGKSTLVKQLMTSEYLANKENNDQEAEEETVISVMLHQQESILHFTEVPSSNFIHSILPSDPPDAYVLVFSVTEQSSFSSVQQCLSHIHYHHNCFHQGIERVAEGRRGVGGGKCPFRSAKKRKDGETYANPSVSAGDTAHKESEGGGIGEKEDCGGIGSGDVVCENMSGVERKTDETKAVVFIVANKQDLVRNRTVSETEVAKWARSKKCRNMEVSALLGLNVDELLVDLVQWLQKQGGEGSGHNEGEDDDEDEKGCFHRVFNGICDSLFK